MRVERMIRDTPSAVAAARTARTVSSLLSGVSDTEVTLRSAQIPQLISAMSSRLLTQNDAHHRAGRYPRIRQIKEKVARLINSEFAVNAAGFLI